MTIAKSNLRTLVSAEEAFKATTGGGRYGTLEELLKAGMISKDMFDHGYKIELSVSENEFELRRYHLNMVRQGNFPTLSTKARCCAAAIMAAGPQRFLTRQFDERGHLSAGADAATRL
ncbi:MAG: hypothetical protein ABR557_06650 [Pyrinomonadaceae bacterium]